MKVRLLLIAEMERQADNVDALGEAEHRLDAFREAVLPYENYGITFHRARIGDVDNTSPVLRSAGWDILGDSQLKQLIGVLDLSMRSRKAMYRRGIGTLGQLCACSSEELLLIKGFGKTSLNEIRDKLAKFNLALRGEGVVHLAVPVYLAGWLEAPDEYCAGPRSNVADIRSDMCSTAPFGDRPELTPCIIRSEGDRKTVYSVWDKEKKCWRGPTAEEKNRA